MGIPLHKVLKKCEQAHWGNTWGGYLQPAEIQVLLEAGYKPCDPNSWKVKELPGLIENGVCNPTWFYFIRNRKKGVWQ